MTFQAYIDNIRAKTGKGPEEFLALAEAKGLLAPGTKAGAVTAWLKADFGLGHGHAMAIYATFKRAGRLGAGSKHAAPLAQPDGPPAPPPPALRTISPEGEI